MALGELLCASIALSSVAFVAGGGEICDIGRTPTAMRFDVIYDSTQAIQQGRISSAPVAVVGQRRRKSLLLNKLCKVPQRRSKYYRTSTPAAKPSVESETCTWISRAAYRGCKPPSISYLLGVSTRKVKAVTEELCGHEFSSATISRMVQTLDEELEKFAQRSLEEPYPYLILDARYEKCGKRVRFEARRCW
jgi:hypothetical protein